MVEAAWIVVALIGAGTLLERASFLVFGGRLQLPDVVQQGLRYVPAAVLSALVLPGLVQPGSDGLPDAARLAAGVVAAAVAWRTHGALLTLVAGMATLWLLRWLGL